MTNLECNSLIALPSIQTLAVFVHAGLKNEVLMTCEAFIAHNLPHNLFNVPHSHAEVLVAVPTAQSHVMALDDSVPDRCRNPCVEVCVNVGWVKAILFEESNHIFELVNSPPTSKTNLHRYPQSNMG